MVILLRVVKSKLNSMCCLQNFTSEPQILFGMACDSGARVGSVLQFLLHEADEMGLRLAVKLFLSLYPLH